jgi:DHA2 family multidrug resistance protein
MSRSLTLHRADVRQRISDLTQHFVAHGVADATTAQHRAIAAISNILHL